MDLQRFDAIRAATRDRLAGGADNLAEMDERSLVMTLTREAMEQFYDDQETRALEYEYVERTVQHAIADFRRGLGASP
jgi:hypothetical protein